jgi:hypothetical protein
MKVRPGKAFGKINCSGFGRNMAILDWLLLSDSEEDAFDKLKANYKRIFGKISIYLAKSQAIMNGWRECPYPNRRKVEWIKKTFLVLKFSPC